MPHPKILDFYILYFIGSSSLKSNQNAIWIFGVLQMINRRLSFVNNIWKENIKSISLHRQWRGIIFIIMRLVISIPFVTLNSSIYEKWFYWHIFVSPFVSLKIYFRNKILLHLSMELSD